MQVVRAGRNSYFISDCIISPNPAQNRVIVSFQFRSRLVSFGFVRANREVRSAVNGSEFLEFHTNKYAHIFVAWFEMGGDGGVSRVTMIRTQAVSREVPG